MGWRFAFPGPLPPVSTLLPVRLAGEAFNVMTPTATLGGEPVKVYLLMSRVSLEEGLVSVIISKTTLVVAQGCFLLMGIALAPRLLPSESPLLMWMVGLAVLGIVAIGGFILAQRRGLLSRVLGWVRAMGLSGRGAVKDVQGVDQAIASFYIIHRQRFVVSTLFHLMGWLAGSVEAYLILWLLGLPISFAMAIVIEAFSSAIKAAGFVIPGALGVQEGGNVVIFLAFGLSAGIGLSFSLIRRVRELAWVAVGLGALAVVRRHCPVPPQE